MERIFVNDIGLSSLFIPKEPIVDIVFVHGLQGHPRRTWTKTLGHSSKGRWTRLLTFGRKRSPNKSGQVDDIGLQDMFWPADLLPDDCPDARILTFGYNSIVTSFFGDAVNQNHPSANAKNLLYALSRVRKDCRTRPLILVAHSLGGVIVKEALRRAETAEDTALKDFQVSLSAIVFLGTPHRGSGYAQIGEVVRRVISATGSDTSNCNLRTLRYDSPELELAREEFTRQWRQGRFIVKTFQEARGFKSFQGLNDKIVPDFSSSLDDPRENAEHIDANHMEMCRFTGRSDTGYVQVGGELADMTDKIRNHQLGPLNPSTCNPPDNGDIVSEDEQACLQSIAFPEMDSRYHGIYKPMDGTCEWLFRRPEYKLWRDNELPNKQYGFLWIKGKPGAGKSTTMKTIVNKIQSQSGGQDSVVLRFFFNTRGQVGLETTMLGLFRSLVCQLLQQSRSLFHNVLPIYKRKVDAHGTDWTWHVHELKEMFFDMAQERRAGTVYIFIDALDECDEADSRDIVMLLQDLYSFSSEKAPVKICLSGRNYPTINTDDCLEIQIDDFNQSDIQTYIERWLRPSDASPGMTVLVSNILNKASGVFLWVVLVVKTLVKARDEGETRSRMLEIVHDLPKQLNDLIRQILQSIAHDQSRDAVNILQWVTFSRRPIGSTELRYALEVGRNLEYKSQRQIVSSPTFIASNSQLAKLVRARTKGLIEVKNLGPGGPRSVSRDGGVSEPLDRVQFIHGSIRDFMLHHQGFLILDSSMQDGPISRSHLRLATTCIQYLGYDDLRDSIVDLSEAGTMTQPQAAETLRSLASLYPFLECAIDGAFSHFYHAEFYGTSSQEGMTSMQGVFDRWRRLADLFLARNFREVRGPSASFAHVAAEHGILTWVIALLHQGFNVNCIGGCYHTLLVTASVMGYEKFVEQLLDSGADVTIEGGRYGNALSGAALSGNTKIVQAILKRGPDVNALCGQYGTALQAAAQASPENEEIINMLLAANADVSIQRGLFGDALQASAFAGNKSIVKRLIDAGANVNVLGGRFGSALQAAASQNHAEIVTILLSEGADPHVEGGDCGSALWIAACGGHSVIVRYLIALDLIGTQSHDADAVELSEELDRHVEETMIAGRNISRFHEAIDEGDVTRTQNLLSIGVDVNVRGGEFSSAWHTAAFSGHADVMSLLLAQEGANPNLRDSEDRTALWYAASQGYVLIVGQLLDTGLMDIRMKSVSGRNLLWWPCYKGFLEVVQLLLKVGVDPHEEDEDGVSPTMAAKEGGHGVVLKLLSLEE